VDTFRGARQFHHWLLLELIGNIPSAESGAEALYYAAQENLVLTA